VQVPQRGSRIAAELVDQPLAQQPVVRERVGLPAAPVPRDHQLPGQALVQRVLGRRGRQLRQQPRVLPPAQRDVVAVQLRREPLGFQPLPHAAEPVAFHVGEGGAPPQLQCRTPQRGGALVVRRLPRPRGQGPELVQVHRRRLHVQPVALRTPAQHRPAGVGEQAAQPRQVRVQGLPGPRRRVGTPHAVDQLVRGDHPRRLDQQDRQHRALPRRAEWHRSPVVVRRHRSQHPKSHRSFHPLPWSAAQERIDAAIMVLRCGIRIPVTGIATGAPPPAGTTSGAGGLPPAPLARIASRGPRPRWPAPAEVAVGDHPRGPCPPAAPPPCTDRPA
jgi:hypothetical protein